MILYLKVLWYEYRCFLFFQSYIIFYLKGNGFESDIALDDISFGQGGNCAYFASTKPSTTAPQLAAFETDFEDGSFDTWQLETTDKPWIIQTGRDAVFGKAPLIDHTKQNTFGKYAYVPIEATGGPVYFSTLGTRLPKGSAFCLDFWYQAFVSSSTTLNVYMQSGTSAATVLWMRPGTTARDQWTHASVNTGVPPDPRHLTISGKIKYLEMNFILLF